jgi:hypothetical protein
MAISTDPAAKALVDSYTSDPLVAAWLKEEGFTVEACPCLRMKDDREDLPWFYRSFDTLGYVICFFDGGLPIRKEDALRNAREAFGPCSVLMY